MMFFKDLFQLLNQMLESISPHSIQHYFDTVAALGTLRTFLRAAVAATSGTKKSGWNRRHCAASTPLTSVQKILQRQPVVDLLLCYDLNILASLS